MIQIEGISLTPKMIDQIAFWQQNPSALEADIAIFDEAISVIACSSGNGPLDNALKCLNTINALCIIKDELKTFKSIQHEQ